MPTAAPPTLPGPEATTRTTAPVRGLLPLCLSEAAERFSFYGMRAVLALFLVDTAHGLGMSPAVATALVGSYLSACYFTALPGGWIADRILGARRAAIAGGVVILAGHVVLALDLGAAGLYTGLVLVAVGTGLQKPNMTALVGTLFTHHGDSRRDAAYSKFYASINIGGLLATLLVGWLGVEFGWPVAFSAAAVAMAASLVVFVGSSGLRAIDDRPAHPLTPAERRRVVRTTALVLLGAAAVGAALADTDHLTLTGCLSAFAVLAVLVPAGYFVRLLRTPDLDERGRDGLRAYLCLFIGAVVFWAIFDLAASSVQLFADRHVDMLGMPTTWQAALNPIMIVLFAGVLAAVWKRVNVSAPAKFATGLVLAGASFLLLAVAATQAGGAVRISLLWLVGLYFLQTIGELFLSPTGLSISHKLAPAGMGSQLAGLFFLSASTGDALGAQVASRLTGTVLYLTLGTLAVLAGCAMVLATPRIRGLIGE
ncbi:peptide MFS transporter [Streptomyces sp. PvR034]|uniref:peptide MFS transporter n=1 Tax=Streptomyces sp. PvR034 TaxID=3156401 RepID=UPI00339627D8